MKNLLMLLLSLFITSSLFAQLRPTDKVYLVFEEVEGWESVNGDDAVQTLNSYINGKTTLEVVDSKETSDYYVKLSVIKKGNKRYARVTVYSTSTDQMVFQSEYQKGKGSSAYYGYSGTRMAVGKLVKKDFIKTFPQIKE